MIPLHTELHQDTPTFGFSEGQRAAQFFVLDTDVPLQVDVPPLQPLNDAFSQYYHYYHDPKIPLSDSPQDRNAAVEAFSQVNPRLPEFAGRLHGTQQSGGQTRPYQHHYLSEYPYLERDEAKRFALHISETIPKPHVPVFPENLKLTAYDVLESPHIHQKNNFPSFGGRPNSQSRTQRSEFRQSPPSAVVAAEENPSRLGIVRDEPPDVPNLSPSYSLPQHPHYVYYPHYQVYEPASFLAAGSPPSTLSEDSSKIETLSSQEPKFEKAQPTGVDHQPRGPLFPYVYRHHDYDMSKANTGKQEVQPARTANSKSEFSDSSGSGVQRRAAVSGFYRHSDASEELAVNGNALEQKSGEEMRQETAV